VVGMDCLVCRSSKAFPIGATGLAICPRCAERIYQPLIDLFEVLRAYGLVSAEERGRRRQPRKAEEAVEAEEQAQPAEAA